MSTGKTPLDPETRRRWSDLGHMAFIDALTAATPLRARQFAFHGGTSLHLSWKSPRFSEDLDFLLDRSVGSTMASLLPRIQRRMNDFLLGHDPDLSAKIDDRTKAGSNLLNYRITLSSPKKHGTAKVKAEFWQVDPGYLDDYDTEFAYPLKQGDMVSRISQPLPAATLEAAYADKLTAFATRAHLKWRDVFDLWWIDRQIDVDVPEMADRFLHHVQAFRTIDNLEPGPALRRFLEREPDGIAAEADPDLRRWLPEGLWTQLEGQGVAQIVDHVRGAIAAVADELASRAPRHDQDPFLEEDADVSPGP